MDELKDRLTRCFQVVFPDLPESEISSASQANTPRWDSVAAITLVNVMEEEFDMEMDFDSLADLISFELVLEYLKKAEKAA